MPTRRDLEEFFDGDGELDPAPGGFDPGLPPDWSAVGAWQVDTSKGRYNSWEAAERRARWLNWEHHRDEEWLFKVGHDEFGYVVLLRRWIGRTPQLIDNSPEAQRERDARLLRKILGSAEHGDS